MAPERSFYAGPVTPSTLMAIRAPRGGGPGRCPCRLPLVGWLLLGALTTGPGTGRGAESLPPSPGGLAPGSPSEFDVTFYRPDQGLPHETVTALLQTRDRYLWVGTPAGLARFNGRTFARLEDDTIPDLASARITALLEDDGGLLWIGTQGLGLLRKDDGGLRRMPMGNGQDGPTVSALARSPDGTVWIGTPQGLFQENADSIRRFTSDAVSTETPVLALHAGRSGILWVTTPQDMYQVKNGLALPFTVGDLPLGRNTDAIGVFEDSSADLWTFGATFLVNMSRGVRINYFATLDPASSRVWTLCEQTNGAFWVGTSGRGLFRFRNERFEVVGVGEGLDQCDVRSLYPDDEGNLWIGTNGDGLARFRPRPWVSHENAPGLAGNRIACLADGPGQRPLIGTSNAGALVPTGSDWVPLVSEPPLNYAAGVQSICRTTDGGVWVAARGVGLVRLAGNRQWHFTTADGLMHPTVLAVAPDPNGSGVWVGTAAGTLHRVTDTECRSWTAVDGLAGQPIRNLLWDDAGTLWIGSEADGLEHWDGTKVTRAPQTESLFGMPVSCLAIDDQGWVWAGTDGAGVFCRDPVGWRRLDITHGLLSNRIRALTQDPAGRFWFASDQGLFYVSPDSMQSWRNGKTDRVRGLRTTPPNPAGSTDTGAGYGTLLCHGARLWYASDGGLASLDTDRLQPSVSPRLTVEGIEVNGESISFPSYAPPPSLGRLGPSVRSLQIRITAIAFTEPELTRFRHRLVGLETEWSEPSAERLITYGALRPGRYHLEVQARGAAGIWAHPVATAAWTVARPFWATWWFFTVAGTTGLAGIWAAVHAFSLRRLRHRLRQSEQARAMERERSRIARDMHDEIGSKLTRISFLSEVAVQQRVAADDDGDPVRAIARSARDLLQALDEIVWMVNPRNDRLASLAGYLESYAHQYFQGTAIHCDVTVEDSVGDTPLRAELRHHVFRAFQEALGNILKHAGADRADIRMQAYPGGFEVEIRDNGTGLTDEAREKGPHHHGLLNMSQRLEAAGGTCSLAGEAGQGTAVYFRIST